MKARSAHEGSAIDGVAWYTRTQAARFLGVKVGAVKAAQARGGLRAERIDGVWCFARAVLDAYRESTPSGVLAAAAFAAFARGASAAEVVIALKIQPATAETLLGSFARCSGACVVACPPIGRAAWADLYGLPPLTPGLLCRALELCAEVPSVRARLLASV